MRDRARYFSVAHYLVANLLPFESIMKSFASPALCYLRSGVHLMGAFYNWQTFDGLNRELTHTQYEPHTTVVHLIGHRAQAS